MNTINNYKETNSGRFGSAFEAELKASFGQKAIVSKAGKIDFRRDRKCFEVKTGAGELDFLFRSKVKYVVYVPVVDEKEPVNRQEGFVLERVTFLELLAECGLIREKTSTNGEHRVTIQTFWNRSKNAPHGKKYFILLDALYEKCLLTLDEYYGADGKFGGA